MHRIWWMVMSVSVMLAGLGRHVNRTLMIVIPTRVSTEPLAMWESSWHNSCICIHDSSCFLSVCNSGVIISFNKQKCYDKMPLCSWTVLLYEHLHMYSKIPSIGTAEWLWVSVCCWLDWGDMWSEHWWLWSQPVSQRSHLQCKYSQNSSSKFMLILKS